MTCKCIACGECLWSGKVFRYDPRSGMDEPETCEDCDGTGIAEFCDECMEESWEASPTDIGGGPND